MGVRFRETQRHHHQALLLNMQQCIFINSMCVLCMYAYEDFLSISFFLFVLLRKPHNHLFYSTAADSFKKRFHYASSALQTSSDHHQNGREKIHTLEYPRGCEKILLLILYFYQSLFTAKQVTKQLRMKKNWKRCIMHKLPSPYSKYFERKKHQS